jgi:hypothetical protein
VLVSLTCRLLVTVLSWLVLFAWSSASKEAEMPALRHEVAIPRRGNSKPTILRTGESIRVRVAADASRLDVPGDYSAEPTFITDARYVTAPTSNSHNPES